MAQVRIDIASEFKDRGFKRAEKSATALERQFKSLGKTFLAVFSTRQIIAFGKAAVNAFEQDELAARRLSTTLNNLNLGFEDPRVKQFISNIEAQTGILDDELRPAMQSLITTTGSVTKAQELLNTAIEVSRGSGESLTTVANDLSKAYVGNTKGLSKYNLGLTKTELQQTSFADLQTLINKQFSGQNAAFLDTYAGKVSMLNVAYANMQETIGKGLVDAFIELSGSNGIAGATNAMDDFALSTSYAIGGAVSYVKLLTNELDKIGVNPILAWFIKNQGPVQLLMSLIQQGKTSATAPKPFRTPMTISGQTDYYKKIDKERDRIEKLQLKRQQELLAMQKKADEERKKRERLALAQKRAATIFDMENIQIVAAMQQKVDGETRLRLTALLALNTQNSLAAEKLAELVMRIQSPALANLDVFLKSGDTIDGMIIKLITSQAKLAGLQLMAEDFPIPENIFEEWEDSLENILKMLAEMLALLAEENAKTSGGITKSVVSKAKLAQLEKYEQKIDRDTAMINRTSASNLGSTSNGTSFVPSSMTTGTNVVVNVAGNVTTQNDLVSAITDALYQSQKDGKNILYSSTAI